MEHQWCRPGGWIISHDAQSPGERSGSSQKRSPVMMLSRTPIRVLCVDDHAFLAEGLQSRLSLARDMEYVGRLSTAEDLVAKAKETRADVVLLDIEMPGPDPFEALE